MKRPPAPSGRLNTLRFCCHGVSSIQVALMTPAVQVQASTAGHCALMHHGVSGCWWAAGAGGRAHEVEVPGAPGRLFRFLPPVHARARQQRRAEAGAPPQSAVTHAGFISHDIVQTFCVSMLLLLAPCCCWCDCASFGASWLWSTTPRQMAAPPSCWDWAHIFPVNMASLACAASPV